MISNRHNIKLSFDRPRYKTEGNVISCELRYRIVVPETAFGAYPKTPNDPQGYIGVDLGMHRTVGKARCNDSDTFDKHIGREMAEARAEAKAYKSASKLIKKYVRDVMQKYYNMALDFEAKADFVQKHNEEYVLDLDSQV